MTSQAKTNKPVSEEEINQAADVLSRLEPGFLPFPIFIQTARLTVTSIVELVPFRRVGDEEIEVFLARRDQDDTLWPNLLCNPGAVFRATDYTEGFESVFKRLFNDDLKTEYQEPSFAGHTFNNTLRGIDSSHVFWVEMKSDPPVGSFYNINNLPEDLVNANEKIIKIALKNYLDYHKD